jgi:hypothetical protein
VRRVGLEEYVLEVVEDEYKTVMERKMRMLKQRRHVCRRIKESLRGKILDSMALSLLDAAVAADDREGEDEDGRDERPMMDTR